MNKANSELFSGLSSKEVENLKKEGKTNYTKKTVGKSYTAILFDNVLTVFNLVGIVVFILLLIAGAWKDTFFAIVIFANTMVGIVQELRAKHQVQKLSILTSAKACVIRDGTEYEIEVDKLVLGDTILLSAGRQVPADSVVLDGYVEANEALLTGESLPIQKKKDDMLLSGSFIVSGKCYAKVAHIGAENYAEQLAIKAKKYRKPKSELMRSISGIIRLIAIVVFPLGAASFYTALKDGYIWNDALAAACGAMIGMIPSGMVLLTSVTLAVSVLKMVKKNTLVQDLYSIEMLARVNVLCLDKTGTITDGTMTVEEITVYDKAEDVASILSSIIRATGDNNETAKALKNHFNGKIIEAKEVLPFSAERKYSAITLDSGTYFFGAPDILLANHKKLIAESTRYNELGLRTLALVKSDGSIKQQKNLKPVALIALSDTLRSDAREIVQWFSDNEVELKVISGDNAATASAVAKKAGIKGAEKYISVEHLSDQELIDAADKYVVFGRVSPDQKAVLIKALKEKGKTVAMTGDGVNDILAMKQADCAVAVASGSEAARSVAHLVLMDNRFSSMPDVVKEGRQVVNNIQNSTSLFLMKTTMTVFTTLLMLMLGNVYPLKPQHLYVIEFFVIGIPAFFLALRHNNTRMSGRFINNIFASTLPKGLALALCVTAVYIFAPYLSVITQEEITMLVMVSVTYAGIIGLIALCIPFTKISIAVAAGSLITSTAAFAILNSYFDYNLHLLTIDKLVFLIITLTVCALIVAAGKIYENKRR